MSRVRRLSIRGVRNFGDETEETIKFHRPLTLIVGQNGVGKTTIIECLRYATTGEYPPGSDRGKGFVHDPSLKHTNTTNVRGCVKAEFVDKAGVVVTVNRIMEAQRTASNIKFKSVDNTISKRNLTTGEEFSVTSRCSDVDVEMRTSLGLSTAILNSIIFCHQDESNWPLGDSKLLKERFDEIFDTSRYNKALEILKKLITDKQSSLRLLNSERKTLSFVLQEVTSKEEKYAEYIRRKDESSSKIKRLRSNLEPIREELGEITEQLDQYNLIMSKIEKKEIEINSAEKQLNNIKSKIKSIFEGDDEELMNSIRCYDDIVEEKMKKIKEIQSAINKLESNINKVSQEYSNKKLIMGSYQQQMKDNEKRVSNRNSVLNQLLDKFYMDSIDKNSSEDDIKKNFNNVKDKIDEMELDLKNIQVENDSQESLKEKEVDSYRSNKTKVDVELKQYKKELSVVQEKIENIKFKINQANEDKKKLNTINEKLNNTNKQIDSIESKMNSENLPDKIKDVVKYIEKEEKELRKLEDLDNQLRNLSSLTSKLESTKADLKSKYSEMNKIKKTHGDDIKKLFGIDDINCDSKLKEKMELIQRDLNKTVEDLKKNIDKCKHKKTSLESSLSHEKQEYNKKISQINCDKEKVSIYCKDYKNYKDEVMIQKDKVEKLQRKRGSMAFQGVAFTDYVKKFSSDNPCCPVCKRGFSHKSEAKDIAKKLEEDLKQHPEMMKEMDAELNIARKNHDGLLSLKAIVDSIVEFEVEEKENRLTKIKEKVELLKKIEQQASEIEKNLVEPQEKILLCNKLAGILALWDRFINEIERLEANSDELEREITEKGISTDKTEDQVLKEKEAARENVREARKRETNMRRQLDQLQSELKVATDKRAKCLEEQLRIHNEVQKIKQLSDEIEESKKNEAKLTGLIQQAKKNLIDAEDEFNSANKELEELKQKNRENLNEERRKVLAFNKKMDLLTTIQDEIDKFHSKNIQNELEICQIEMKDCEKQLEKLKEDKGKKEEVLDKIREDISSQETAKRNLNDNLELREKEKMLKKLLSENRRLKNDLSEINSDELKERKASLENKYQNYDREINIEKGKETEMMRNAELLKEELEMEQYKLAKEKYKKKWLQAMVTEDVIADLNSYYKALDSALSEYHEERMNVVNQTMKKLWKLIYSGTDTTSIQIRTEATSGTTARRQFNYKLVQTKHGVEMDMRGRCSAGQRVLASIVIRLALAETFCDQCGILALDEPTTNLDVTNSGNLAEALYNYVKMRSAYEKSFQLIIITHDENFISKLKELNTSDYVYELYRGNNGLTQIRTLYNDHSVNNLGNNRLSLARNDDDSDAENTGRSGKTLSRNSNANKRKRPNSPGGSLSARSVRKKPVFHFD